MIGYLAMANSRRKGFGYLNDMTIKIELERGCREIRTCHDVIRGTLRIQVNKNAAAGQDNYEFKDLRIQLEGTASIRFQTRVDNRLTNHVGDDRFLAPENPNSSHLCFYFFTKDDPLERRTLTKGLYTFPFEIQLSGESLAAPFQTPFGRVMYKLVAYAGIWVTDIVAAETIIRTKGYLDLSSLDVSLVSCPFTVSRKKDKSFFSKKTVLKVDLSLTRRGFVPGENLPFQLVVENIQCETLTRLSCSFTQKITYYVGKVSKSTSSVLETLEYFSTDDPNTMSGGEINWSAAFSIPPNLMPTFTKEKNKSVEINYFLLFQVDVNNKSGLKGDLPIIIGTTRGESETSSGAPNTNTNPSSSTSTSTNNSTPDFTHQSLDSTWDTNSVQSFSTLPPSYSTLTSRRPSLETLPPNYDSFFGDMGPDYNEMRPRSSSNNM